MESFIYCINAIVPVFIMIILGKVISVTGGADRSFFDRLNHLSYRYIIPTFLFLGSYDADLTTAFNYKLIGFCFIGVLFIFFGAWFLSSKFLKRSQVAAFTQACYRGNYILMAFPIVKGLLGNHHVARAMILSPFVVALYSTLAVTIFTIYSADGRVTGFRKVINIIQGVVKNPFIISTFLGIIVNLLGITIPAVVLKPIEYISDLTTPVALIGLGGTLGGESLMRNIKPAAIAAFVKTVIAPAIMIPMAIFMGFRGIDLAIIAIIFSTPMPSNSYHMAKALGGDAELTGGAILLSTAMSVISLVITMTILMSNGLVY